ncbi:exodeoxyribonuclease III [Pseudoalteromonas luteoviolacea]|uniref:Exonuclease III n=1 Tax=Pseudoalteromonas luteoviolacea H33 TaxID=1365251 RepID=A0A161ZKF7_9GAMM|nr:exodeoxyribonuclease III [Pseudoalteromonas luteoviolacea]KZN45278.1 exonuclease III [Pseudoalteromonas luteoviolacea H33]KZN70858.1 exonuclease III [Pseudoalteromonas luteoviolacea H33-S]MBQ4877188.1 exodeoxyribonuclease III [Pseudoalteromonas luteoviolacea]MBQ4906049.1 exodeoxyribonuclease III [Pseudoalteromonas luteoviolacea]
MKIISFNINGLRARLHQLQALIDKHQPDVIGLQEIKVHDEAFPIDDVEAMGYNVYFHGQKAHYGVALLSKKPAKSILKGFATDTEEAQKRMITGVFESDNGKEVTVMNGYFPQGDNISHETKFPYKRQFYKDLMTHLNNNESPEANLVVMGDINISPTDSDIGIGEPNMKRWLKTGKCSFQPEEREWLKTLMDWGLKDTFRELTPDAQDKYSWFDYRSKGFNDNRGLRIDVVLATESLMATCTESDIDYELRGIEKPSDHAPIWATFDI